MNYVSIDRVFSRIYRNIGDTSINQEDLVEWTGEALDQLIVSDSVEMSVNKFKVENYTLELPNFLVSIIQLAKWEGESDCTCSHEIVQSESTQEVSISSKDKCNTCYETERIVNDYSFENIFTPLAQLYNSSLRYGKLVPIRKSNKSLYENFNAEDTNCFDKAYQYQELNNRLLRFNFQEGYVILSYKTYPVDEKTGYPKVPDNISIQTAIEYYIKWKLAERYSWTGKPNFENKLKSSYELWLKYCDQAVNYQRMPKTIDDYQDLLEQSQNIIPNDRRYYTFFSNLSRQDRRAFADSSNSNHNINPNYSNS